GRGVPPRLKVQAEGHKEIANIAGAAKDCRLKVRSFNGRNAEIARRFCSIPNLWQFRRFWQSFTFWQCLTIFAMSIPFAEYAARVQEHLERDWGIPVITRDIPDPLTGDLDGAEIDVDYAITPELRLFLLGHLFGHTVQWNVNESAFDLGRQYKPPVDEALFPEVLAYEGEAARYGLQLLHEMGIIDVDQWFSNYTAADQAYLLHFYRTGDKGEFKNFWREGAPL